MSFKRFCPKCGKETNNLVGKECLECFLGDAKLFTINNQKISVCKYCEKAIMKGQWHDFSEKLISEEVASKIKVNNDFNMQDIKIIIDIEKKDDGEYEALVNVKGFIKDNLVEQEKVITVVLHSTTCDSCMKLNSEYREAIIQLRGRNSEESEQMLKLAEDLLDKERAKDSLSGVSKIIQLKQGYDLWVGSKKAAVKVSRYIAKLYHSKLKVSSKLIGEEKDGKRKYRQTFCIKL